MAGPQNWKMVLAKETGTAGTNLVTNGDFSTNVTGWTLTSGLVTNQTLTRQTASWTGHSAGYARLFADASAGGGTRSLAAESTTGIALTQNTQYFAQATIKIVSYPTLASAGKGVSFDARFYSGSGTLLNTSTTSGTIVTSDDQGEAVVSLSFTMPSNAATCKLRVIVSADGSSVAVGDDIEVLFDDVILYSLADISWTATNVGDLYNARDRQFSFRLNQPQTIGFTLPITDPMAAEIISAVGESTAIPIIKLYRDTTLKMTAEVTSLEIVNSNYGNAVRVVATETMWPRLAKRLLPDSRARAGYKITSPQDRLNVVSEQLTDINAESPSGIVGVL